MAASDHLNTQQHQVVTLYRGLRGVSHPDEMDPELIGPHWTHSKERAEEFAGPTGSVVTAEIPRENILYDGQTKQAHEDFYGNYNWQNSAVYRVMPDVDEEETFVRPDTPIGIRGMRTHPENPIKDKWRFNPPMMRNSEKLYAYSAKKGGGDITEWILGES
jgi:hypothetical protein